MKNKLFFTVKTTQFLLFNSETKIMKETNFSNAKKRRNSAQLQLYLPTTPVAIDGEMQTIASIIKSKQFRF